MEKLDRDSSDTDKIHSNLKKEKCKRSHRVKTHQMTKYTINELTKELLYKPHILKFILHLQKCLRRRKRSLKSLKLKYKNMISSNLDTNDASTQTESEFFNTISANETDVSLSWKVGNNVENSVSLADQVKEAAESALQQTGMVYEETSGMYYDYNTGYYYNATTGLYYHNSTGCYYYYDKEQNTFTFHSHADISDFPNQQDEANYNLSKKSKSKKSKKVGLCEPFEDIANNMAAMSLQGCRIALGMFLCKFLIFRHYLLLQEKLKIKEDSDKNVDSIEPKTDEEFRKRTKLQKDNCDDNSNKKIKLDQKCNDNVKDKEISTKSIERTSMKIDIFCDIDDSQNLNEDSPDVDSVKINSNIEESENISKDVKSEGEYSTSDVESDSSSSNESVAGDHPPCIRIIVSESSVGKLKVGSLFILTKEGGTLGREGTSHAILIPEENVSRHHLTFTYDEDLSSYYVKDVGSRNGTILNGIRISETKTESDLVKIVHGSILQLGSTKLLCHIHKGNDTCGHCEPGLLIKETVPAPKIYKSINLKAMHKQELRRLREKYKVNPGKTDGNDQKLMPEGYEDKAQLRREKVGSLHHGAKTEQASLDTTIASTNKGFKLLQKMGWSVGDGLGKTAQGNTDPVKLLSNVGTSGLGAVNLDTLSNLSQSGVSNSRRQGIWLAAQKRYDKATTSLFFNQDESDDENPDDNK